MVTLQPFLPPLHTGAPEPTGFLYSHWMLDPKVALYIIAITAAYLFVIGPWNRSRPGSENRPVTRAQVRWFMVGQLALFVSLGPPLDDWAYYYFSSAHMIQHLILMFIVAPAWIKGIPPWVFNPIIRSRRGRFLLTFIPRAVPGFLFASLIIALWHVPVFYNATLNNELIHVMQHQFFLVAGFLFFWPLMSTVKESPQLSPPMKSLYLFAQTIPSGIVGATIVYAAPPLYPHYADATVRPWGLSIADDQVLGGMFMWVGMNLVFLTLLSIIFLRWASAEDRKEREPRAAGGELRQRIAPVPEPRGHHQVISG
jgi:putative membrane protein